METGVAVVLVALVVAAAIAVALRGRLSGSARVGDAELRVKAGRDPEPRPGAAAISDSTALAGDASAIGPGGARIDRTFAGGDLTARAGGEADPKA